MSLGYEYDSEYSGGKYNPDNSGEVTDHFEVKPPPESNEFTNNEMRDSLDADAETSTEYSKSIAESSGLDLNSGAIDVATKESANENVGENLNDNQLDSVLDNFKEDNWSDLSLEEQKQSMTDLADCVAADTGNENPPEIVFRDDMPDGSYGGYNPETNTMEINENMLDDSKEAADTIAHEMWHAYQQQEASKVPPSEKGQEYQEGFDNYISPEYDFEEYENQMVEAEAREYAQGFKDRLQKAA